MQFNLRCIISVCADCLLFLTKYCESWRKLRR